MDLGWTDLGRVTDLVDCVRLLTPLDFILHQRRRISKKTPTTSSATRISPGFRDKGCDPTAT